MKNLSTEERTMVDGLIDRFSNLIREAEESWSDMLDAEGYGMDILVDILEGETDSADAYKLMLDAFGDSQTAKKRFLGLLDKANSARWKVINACQLRPSNKEVTKNLYNKVAERYGYNERE